MEGKQEFEIGERVESTGKFWIFAKYIFPFLGLLLIVGLLIAALILIPFFTDFGEFTKQGMGIGAIALILLVILMIR